MSQTICNPGPAVVLVNSRIQASYTAYYTLATHLHPRINGFFTVWRNLCYKYLDTLGSLSHQLLAEGLHLFFVMEVSFLSRFNFTSSWIFESRRRRRGGESGVPLSLPLSLLDLDA